MTINILSLNSFSVYAEYFIGVSVIYVLILFILVVNNIPGSFFQNVISEAFAIILLFSCLLILNENQFFFNSVKNFYFFDVLNSWQYLLNIVLSKSNKSRFFSSNSNKSINYPSVNEWTLHGYFYGHCDFRGRFIEDFVIIHNRNYFVSVSVWHPNKESLLKILNSSHFDTIILEHQKKFGNLVDGCFYFDIFGTLWVHPILCVYFVPMRYKFLWVKTLGFSEFKLPTYEQLCNIFPDSCFKKNQKTYLIKKLDITYHIPSMEYDMINHLRSILQIYSWSTFDFKYGMFFFTTGKKEGPYAHKPKVYVGVVKNYQSNLIKKLQPLKKYYSNMELLHVIKFDNNYDSEFYNFEESILNELKKISKPFEKKLSFETDITAFPNISKEKLTEVVLSHYNLNSHTCAICPAEFIKKFNESV